MPKSFYSFLIKLNVSEGIVISCLFEKTPQFLVGKLEVYDYIARDSSLEWQCQRTRRKCYEESCTMALAQSWYESEIDACMHATVSMLLEKWEDDNGWSCSESRSAI